MEDSKITIRSMIPCIAMCRAIDVKHRAANQLKDEIAYVRRCIEKAKAENPNIQTEGIGPVILEITCGEEMVIGGFLPIKKNNNE